MIANFQDQISNFPISPLFHIHLLVNRFGEFDESKFVYTEYGEYRKLVKGSYTLTLQETSDVKRKFSMLFLRQYNKTCINCVYWIWRIQKTCKEKLHFNSCKRLLMLEEVFNVVLATVQQNLLLQLPYSHKS